MKYLRRYLIDLSLALQGMILMFIDRAKRKEFDVDYIDKLRSEINIYRGVTGDKITADEVVVTNSLEQYNIFQAYGFSDYKVRELAQYFAQYGMPDNK